MSSGKRRGKKLAQAPSDPAFNTFLSTETANGNIAKHEVQYNFLRNSEQNCLKDIIGTRHLSELGTNPPIYDAFNGFKGQSAGVFRTGYNFDQNKSITTDTDFCLWVYVANPGAVISVLAGVENATTGNKLWLFERVTGEFIKFAAAGASFAYSDTALSRNSLLGVRRSGTTVEFLINGVVEETQTDTSLGLPDLEMFIFGSNNTDSEDPSGIFHQASARILAAGFGAYSIDQAALLTSIQTQYANVYAAPVTLSAEVGDVADNKIIIPLDKTVYGTVPAAGDFSVSVGGQTTLTGVALINDGQALELTTTGNVNSGADGSVTYTKGVNILENNAGNDLESFGPLTISNSVGADVTAPTVISLFTTEDDKIRMVFDEPVENVAASKDDFNFDGDTADITADTVDEISETEYDFNFASAWGEAENINADYTQGTVQDKAPTPNLLANFSDIVVVNNIGSGLLPFADAVGWGVEGGGNLNLGAYSKYFGTNNPADFPDYYEVTGAATSGVGSLWHALSTITKPRVILINHDAKINNGPDVKIENPYVTIYKLNTGGDGFALVGSKFKVFKGYSILRGLSIYPNGGGELELISNAGTTERYFIVHQCQVGYSEDEGYASWAQYVVPANRMEYVTWSQSLSFENPGKAI